MEMLTTIAVISILSLVGYRIFHAMVSSYTFSIKSMELGLETQLALERIVRELKTAGSSEVTIPVSLGTSIEVRFVYHSTTGTAEVRYYATGTSPEMEIYRDEGTPAVTDLLIDKVTEFAVDRRNYDPLDPDSLDYYIVRIATWDSPVGITLETGVNVRP